MSKQEHPHAGILRAIADGEKMQYLSKIYNEWVDMSHMSALCHIYEMAFEPENMRIKPRTININGFKVPEPMRKAPTASALVYLADPTDTELVKQFYAGDTAGLITMCFESGLVHSTEEAAVIHAKALLSFTSSTKE